MGENQENLWVMVQKTAVFRGMRGSGPIGESGELPQMEPHYMLRLECDDCEVLAEMSEETAKHLREQLSVHVR